MTCQLKFTFLFNGRYIQSKIYSRLFSLYSRLILA